MHFIFSFQAVSKFLLLGVRSAGILYSFHCYNIPLPRSSWIGPLARTPAARDYRRRARAAWQQKRLGHVTGSDRSVTAPEVTSCAETHRFAGSDGVSRLIFASLGLEGYRSRSQAYCLDTLNTATIWLGLGKRLQFNVFFVWCRWETTKAGRKNDRNSKVVMTFCYF